MEKLYLLAIDGRMYYINGTILPKQYDTIDQIINQVDLEDGNNKYTDYLNRFLKEVNKILAFESRTCI